MDNPAMAAKAKVGKAALVKATAKTNPMAKATPN
jgi:hypothetical protein